jgi:hypothetical protein
MLMQSEWEKYQAQRSDTEKDAIEKEYKKFKGIDQEFDGGDSGGGVVGDGNTDLEDQHNSATLGALRGGVSDLAGSGINVGRGNVKSATESRTASAGANYFGRSTGLADKLKDEITDKDLKTGRMDCVRAQQKENWFNQRAIHASNRAQGQGVVYGEDQGARPREGGFNTRDSLSSDAWRKGGSDGEVSQRDLADHLKDLASLPAQRLDGQDWEAVTIKPDDSLEETFEMRVSPRQTAVTEIKVRNDYNTFAPFRCGFVGDSGPFSVDPGHGSMNRRSGEPVEVVVRFKPMESGVVSEAILVFETEDMRKLYKFIGST